MDNEQLKAWTCSKCGAALPEIKDKESAVKCTHCGTVFSVPQETARSGGVQISGDNIVIYGDVVGGDRIIGGMSKTEALNGILVKMRVQEEDDLTSASEDPDA